VIVFPCLHDVSGTRIYSSKVADFLKAKKVDAVDLAPYFTGKKASELIVNAMDAHPSVAVHKQVAELLFKHIQSAS